MEDRGREATIVLPVRPEVIDPLPLPTGSRGQNLRPFPLGSMMTFPFPLPTGSRIVIAMVLHFLPV